MRTAFGILVGTLIATPGLAAQEPSAPAWEIMMGVGGIVSPSYPGADEYRVTPFPLTKVSYRNRVFLGPSASGTGVGLGAYALRTSRVGLAVEVGFQDGRPVSRADNLAGMSDRDYVATAGATLSLRMNPVEGSLSVTQGLNDDAGLLGSASVSFSRPLGSRVIATVGVGATMADARQMRREFGVADAESLRRQALIAAGDDRLEPDEGAAYRPRAGLRHLGASLSLVYLVSHRWAFLAFGGVERLGSEAAASPLVRRREQISGGIGLGYRF